MTAILNQIARACMAMTSVMMVTLIVIFGWLVWGRYVINSTPTWVEQAALLLVVWISFLGAAVGVRRRSHLSIDFIRDALPAWIGRPLAMIAHVLMTLFGMVMAWQGWLLAAGTMSRKIPMLNISEAWRALPLSICGVLVALFSLAHLHALVTKRADCG
jgi:TRAP-type C4-dicarboxylate transport system permease small subunit